MKSLAVADVRDVAGGSVMRRPINSLGRRPTARSGRHAPFCQGDIAGRNDITAPPRKAALRLAVKKNYDIYI